MPSFVRVCQACGWELYPCPSCGDLACRCATNWAGGRRQHYDKNGEPYQLADSLRYSPEAQAERKQIAEARLLRDGGMNIDAIAEELDVSRRTVFRWLAIPS